MAPKSEPLGQESPLLLAPEPWVPHVWIAGVIWQLDMWLTWVKGAFPCTGPSDSLPPVFDAAALASCVWCGTSSLSGKTRGGRRKHGAWADCKHKHAEHFSQKSASMQDSWSGGLPGVFPPTTHCRLSYSSGSKIGPFILEEAQKCLCSSSVIAVFGSGFTWIS